MRLAAAALIPLSPDEAYYWVWSKALAPGYLDHPPMVALWIRAGTLLAGATPLGVRLLAPLSALLGSWLIAGAAEDCFPARGAGVVAASLLNATLALGVGAVVMTPDTPLLLFWTATLAALARLLRTGDASWWLAAGLALGLAVASKYTGVLLGAAIVAWLGLHPAARRWLRAWQAWAGGALALLVFSPVLAWNAAHGWASFAKQGGRAGDWHPARAAHFLVELLAGQIGLATPLIFALFCLGIWRAARVWRDPACGLLLAVTLLPAAVFAQHALGDRVQANWPCVIYPGAALAAAGLGRRFWRPAAALGVAIGLGVYAQALAAPLPLPRRLDATLFRLGGWPGLATATAQRAGGGFIAADEYGLAAEMSFYRPGAEILGIEPRWRLFRLPVADFGGRTGLLIVSTRRAGGPDAREWSSVRSLGTLARSRRGDVAETYNLYAVTARAGITGVELDRH